MRVLCITLCVAASAFAQNEKVLYTTDINGNRVASATSDSSDDTHRELSRSINGRSVPLETTETHTISKTGSHVVTETITKKYNPNGELAYTERRVTDTESLAGGGSNKSVQVYSTDVNGSFRETERQQIQERVQGASKTLETTVQRPNLSGAFETAEQRSARTQTAGAKTETDETVYRRSQNGELYPALKQVKVQTQVNKSTVTEQVADYEPGVTGNLQLARQTVSTSVTDAAGNETKQVSLYAASVDGRVQEAGAPLQVKEQQTISRQAGPGGSVVETLSVQRPSLADPGKLGSPQVISETVCTGNCN